jgi:serine/threonine-protein kinase
MIPDSMAATITTPAKRNAMYRKPLAPAARPPVALEVQIDAPHETSEVLSTSRGGRRYELLGEIATGGMATVHLARLRRPMGFSRLVAIKHMHPQYAKDPDFAAMFVDEARLTARLRHPNIVPTVDIVAQHGHLLLVMEYVEGASLSSLVRLLGQGAEKMPVGVACAIIHDVLLGLQAAHEATDDEGQPLGIIHRDVSPQNVLVGTDGLARLLDFGVAKARSSVHHSVDGEIRGKVPYMAPEQLFGEGIGPIVDVWSVGVVLWEMLTGARLFDGNEQALVHRIANERPAPPSARGAASSSALDAIVLRALEQDPSRRWASALEMAEQLAQVVRLATRSEVSSWMKRHVAPRSIPKLPVCAPEAAAIAQILDGSRSVASSAPEARAAQPADRLSTTTSAMAVDASRTMRTRSFRRSFLAIPVALVLVASAAAAAIAEASGSAPAAGAFDRGHAAVAVAMAEASAAASARAGAAPALAPASAAAPAGTVAAPPAAVTTPAAWAPPVHRAAQRSASTSAAGAPKGDCRLPYAVDADGNRHYKVECL